MPPRQNQNMPPIRRSMRLQERQERQHQYMLLQERQERQYEYMLAQAGQHQYNRNQNQNQIFVDRTHPYGRPTPTTTTHSGGDLHEHGQPGRSSTAGLVEIREPTTHSGGALHEHGQAASFMFSNHRRRSSTPTTTTTTTHSGGALHEHRQAASFMFSNHRRRSSPPTTTTTTTHSGGALHEHGQAASFMFSNHRRRSSTPTTTTTTTHSGGALHEHGQAASFMFSNHRRLSSPPTATTTTTHSGGAVHEHGQPGAASFMFTNHRRRPSSTAVPVQIREPTAHGFSSWESSVRGSAVETGNRPDYYQHEDIDIRSGRGQPPPPVIPMTINTSLGSILYFREEEVAFLDPSDDYESYESFPEDETEPVSEKHVIDMEEMMENHLSKRIHVSSANPEEEAEICVICQAEYENNEVIVGLACGHDYHKDCMKTWLLQRKVCPVCKATAL